MHKLAEEAYKAGYQSVMEKMSGRTDQVENILKLLNLGSDGSNRYIKELMQAVRLPSGAPERADAAKTLLSLKNRTVMAPESSYARSMNKTLGLKDKIVRRASN